MCMWCTSDDRGSGGFFDIVLEVVIEVVVVVVILIVVVVKVNGIRSSNRKHTSGCSGDNECCTITTSSITQSCSDGS